MNFTTCYHFILTNNFPLMDNLSRTTAALGLQTKHFVTDFQFTSCVLVNRSLPLEVQFIDESVACSPILASFWQQCRVL